MPTPYGYSKPQRCIGVHVYHGGAGVLAHYPMTRNCPDSNGDKRLNAHSYELCPTALRPSDAANLRKGAQHSKNFCLLQELLLIKFTQEQNYGFRTD